MNKEFAVHILTDDAKQKAHKIAVSYDELLEQLKLICPHSREFSIAVTKLEESCFFAKKAMASAPGNAE